MTPEEHALQACNNFGWNTEYRSAVDVIADVIRTAILEEREAIALQIWNSSIDVICAEEVVKRIRARPQP